MGGNFKVRCIDLCGQNLDTCKLGKVYEVVNGKLISESGYPIGGDFNSVDDVNKFSASKFEAVTEKKYSGEYISIKRRKNRVVAVMSLDGKYQRSANVKLKDFDGGFAKAAKAAVDKLLSFDCKTNEKVGGNFKAKCIRTIDNGLTVGKVYEVVNGYSAFDNGEVMPNFVQAGISIFTCFEDMKKWFAVKGFSEFEEVKEAEEIPNKPSFRIVKQDKYDVGDKVKVRNDIWLGEYHPHASVVSDMLKYAGQIVTVKKINQPNDNFYINEDDGNWCWAPEMMEGKVVEDASDKPAVKEVERPAKVGEWIKIVNADPLNDEGQNYSVGDIFKVTKTYACCASDVEVEGVPSWIDEKEYVVLENYQPEDKSLDSNPESEQPTTSTGMREVKREAKAGDVIKIVNNDGNMSNEYENGDILRVLKSDFTDYGGSAYYKNERWKYAKPSEYVVLENYDYSLGHPKNEPFRKAKVGDKIKVVRDRISHLPEINIGDILAVKRVDGTSITTTNGQILWDEDQEYIIIEEAPEVKPDTIEIGDTVKVIDSGKCYSTYSDWFNKFAPKYASRYAYGQSVEKGFVGKVIAKHAHGLGGDMLYAIQNLGYEVYLIGEKGIEKVRD